MKGILWYVTRKLEGIFDGILMEFYIKSSEDKNQIQKSMYIPWFLSSSSLPAEPILIIIIRSTEKGGQPSWLLRWAGAL